MNPNAREPHELWDDYRDGALDDADRRRFEAWLRVDEDARRRWRAESLWLAALSEEAPVGDDDGAAFTRRVMERYAAGRAVRAVLWRVGGALAAAAMVGLVISAFLLADRAAEPQFTPEPVATQAEGDPVGVLVADLGRQLNANPIAVAGDLEVASMSIDFGRLVSLLRPADGRPDASTPAGRQQ